MVEPFLPSDPRLALATELVTEAGRLILDRVNRRGILKNKDSRELVTEADRQAERLIVDAICASFPADAVLGEEFGLLSGSSGYVWVIDPIDGTTNYVQHLPVFCVSIAVIRHGHPIIGMVYDPNRGDLFSAVRGAGAFRNGVRLQARWVPLSSQSVFGFSSRFVGPSPSHVIRMLEYFDEYRNIGSAALHLCYIASGWLDGAFSDSTKLWDIAAGGLMVEEAGGRILDFDTSPAFPLNHALPHYTTAFTPFIATGGSLNQTILYTLFQNGGSDG